MTVYYDALRSGRGREIASRLQWSRWRDTNDDRRPTIEGYLAWRHQFPGFEITCLSSWISTVRQASAHWTYLGEPRLDGSQVHWFIGECILIQAGLVGRGELSSGRIAHLQTLHRELHAFGALMAAIEPQDGFPAMMSRYDRSIVSTMPSPPWESYVASLQAGARILREELVSRFPDHVRAAAEDDGHDAPGFPAEGVEFCRTLPDSDVSFAEMAIRMTQAFWHASGRKDLRGKGDVEAFVCAFLLDMWDHEIAGGWEGDGVPPALIELRGLINRFCKSLTNRWPSTPFGRALSNYCAEDASVEDDELEEHIALQAANFEIIRNIPY